MRTRSWIAFLSLLACGCHHTKAGALDCVPPDGTPPASSHWMSVKGHGLEAKLVEPFLNEAVPGLLTIQSISGASPRYKQADSAGLVRFDTLSPGRYIVRARGLGYQERTDTLTVSAGQRWIGDIRLPKRPLRLEDDCGFPIGLP